MGSGATIDLLSIDIEGMEADVLRCFPFEAFGVHAVLIETNKATDMRVVDRFFHRHGFSNVETFTNALAPGRAYWLDNLFVRQPKQIMYPSWQFERAQTKNGQSGCPQSLRRFMRQWCQPWHQWRPSGAEWDECVQQ